MSLEELIDFSHIISSSSSILAPSILHINITFGATIYIFINYNHILFEQNLCALFCNLNLVNCLMILDGHLVCPITRRHSTNPIFLQNTVSQLH